ncbi:hypothetical protein HK100_011800 [Physocladia obscura]|uniref:Uncharacterized protein n=1 Tax=Physocladia obscura TaxID=109957 RepID=A0AAD5T384_9FUNG|nr:hypothetical protein HK100_011800 [Physocladia obscura]
MKITIAPALLLVTIRTVQAQLSASVGGVGSPCGLSIVNSPVCAPGLVCVKPTMIGVVGLPGTCQLAGGSATATSTTVAITVTGDATGVTTASTSATASIQQSGTATPTQTTSAPGSRSVSTSSSAVVSVSIYASIVIVALFATL